MAQFEKGHSVVLERFSDSLGIWRLLIEWSKLGSYVVGIPEHFTLVFPADGLHMPCRVVWRKERRIGVTFE